MKITIEKNRSPKEFDIAFTSIDDEGHLGDLNRYVMAELGYPEGSKPNLTSLTGGFFWFNLPGRIPIMYIVTVSSEKTETNLAKNLTNAFRFLDDRCYGKRLWIPLMGTGVGELEEERSFDITVNALLAIYKDLAPAEVVISVSSHFDDSLVKNLGARLPIWKEESKQVEVIEKQTVKRKVVKRDSLVDKPTQPKVLKEKQPYKIVDDPLELLTDDLLENTTIRATSISNDGCDKDSLDFDKEAQSLAALVALKELKPPLAIALFGTWGSGKSFFMKQMEKRIRELSIYQGFIVSGKESQPNRSDSNQLLFHSGIAHITLNAWSYLDANLWAGLTHSLFEKLNEYITNNTKSSIEKFKVQVKITKRLEVLHNDMNHFKEKKNQLINLKEKLEKERDSKILRHFQLHDYDESVKQFLKDVGVQEDEIKLLTPSNMEKLIKSGVSFITYLKANSYSVLIKLVGFTALFLIAKFGLQELVDAYNLTEPGKLSQFFHSTTVGILTPIIPVLAPVIRFFYSKKTTIDRVEKYIKDISTDNTDVSQSKAIVQLRSDLKEVDDLILEIETSIDEEYSKTSDITQLAITNFISSKNEQEAYQKHLGIITTIRKDFETLSELFSDINKPEMPLPSVREQEHRESIETDKAVITESFHTNKKLERIILYIDDLDRCSDDKVMEVLEAVHLLMAFPLFIVIVGVDERSVHNALINRQLDRYRGIDHSVINDHFHKVAPREYLEKIFQIPFHLPVPEASGILKLIDDLIPVVGPATIYKIPETEERNPDFNSPQLNIDQQDRVSASELPTADPDTSSTSLKEEASSRVENTPPAPQKIVAIAPENVLITSEEKEYLQLLSCLIGTNPRTIKRYINIYRIVKTHDNKQVANKERMVTLLMLTALFTGQFKETAYKMFQIGNESVILMNATKVNTLNANALQKQFSALSKQDPILKKLLEKPIGSMQEDSEFIQRFSYRIGMPA